MLGTATTTSQAKLQERLRKRRHSRELQEGLDGDGARAVTTGTATTEAAAAAVAETAAAAPTEGEAAATRGGANAAAATEKPVQQTHVQQQQPPLKKKSPSKTIGKQQQPQQPQQQGKQQQLQTAADGQYLKVVRPRRRWAIIPHCRPAAPEQFCRQMTVRRLLSSSLFVCVYASTPLHVACVTL
jgi:hypothetical protein